jgi:hypothetical protein
VDPLVAVIVMVAFVPLFYESPRAGRTSRQVGDLVKNSPTWHRTRLVARPAPGSVGSRELTNEEQARSLHNRVPYLSAYAANHFGGCANRNGSQAARWNNADLLCMSFKLLFLEKTR